MSTITKDTSILIRNVVRKQRMDTKVKMKLVPNVSIQRLRKYISAKVKVKEQSVQEFVPLNIDMPDIRGYITSVYKSPYWENKILKEKLRQTP